MELFQKSSCLVVVFADFTTLNLTRNGFRQFIDEFDDTWIFVGSRRLFDMVLQLFRELWAGDVAALFGENDGCLDDLSTDRIRSGGDGAFQNAWMLHEGGFDFEGGDAVAGTFDNIVIAADEPNVSV